LIGFFIRITQKINEFFHKIFAIVKYSSYIYYIQKQLTMTTEQHLELLTKAVLNLTKLTDELQNALTDLHLGTLAPNESFNPELWRTLEQAKSNALVLNQLLDK
jgi:hypothetical protein